jgi:hypothetical protein
VQDRQQRHRSYDRALLEVSTVPNQNCQLLLMFRQQMPDLPESRRLCMRDDQFTLDDVIGIQLALDTDRLVFRAKQGCCEMQTPQ